METAGSHLGNENLDIYIYIHIHIYFYACIHVGSCHFKCLRSPPQAMADPTDLVGYTPDLQTSGVWFGELNAVAHRGCFPRELSLVWAFLPDPRARPIPHHHHHQSSHHMDVAQFPTAVERGTESDFKNCTNIIPPTSRISNHNPDLTFGVANGAFETFLPPQRYERGVRNVS